MTPLTCTVNDCGKRTEGSTGLCATHNRLNRAVDSAKMPADPKPVKKVSDVQSKLLARYVQMKKKFMLNRWCAYHGHPCLPVDVHHQRGKVGFADDQEIPLLLDTRYWIAVCRQAHDWIEKHPAEAKAQGFSEDRLTKTNH